MAQTFLTINPTDLVSDSRSVINTNFETLRSSFEGTNFPSNPVKGQIAYINTILYVYDGSNWVKIWDENTDGSGYGLNADQLSGHDISEFVLNNQDLNFSHRIHLTTDYEVTLTNNGSLTIGNTNSYNLTMDSDEIQARYNGNTSNLYINPYGGLVIINSEQTGVNASPIRIGTQQYKVWHEGNDGSGSGLDADKLDGYDSAYFTNADNLDAGTVPTERLSGTYTININGNATSANKVNNTITFNNSGSGDPSGTTFDGSTAKTISYNTIGAFPTSGGTITGDLTVKGKTTLGDALTDTTTIKGDLTVSGDGTHYINTSLASGNIIEFQVNGVKKSAISVDGDFIGNASSASKINNAITFSNTGGASIGSTFDGSSALTVSYATVGAAPSSHTHSGGDITSAVANAINATNADYATNATHAINADYATNATNADYATNATNADYATNATNADYATNAGDSTKWNGGEKIINTSDASGSASDGSVWFKYT